MCKPREATISWIHLACVNRRWLQNRLRTWSRLQNKRLRGLHLEPLVKPLQKPSQTGLKFGYKPSPCHFFTSSNFIYLNLFGPTSSLSGGVPDFESAVVGWKKVTDPTYSRKSASAQRSRKRQAHSLTSFLSPPARSSSWCVGRNAHCCTCPVETRGRLLLVVQSLAALCTATHSERMIANINK